MRSYTQEVMLPEYTYPEKREEKAWSVMRAAWGDENNLSWYVRNSEEELIRKVGDLISEAADRPKRLQSKWSKADGEWMEAEKNAFAVCEKKRKVLTGIELGSGSQKEIWRDVLRP